MSAPAIYLRSGFGQTGARRSQLAGPGVRPGTPSLVFVLVGFIVCSQLLDVLTTLISLTHGLTEENPYMAMVISALGPVGFFAAKVGFAAAISGAVIKLGGRAAVVGAAIATLLTGVAVVSNLHMLALAG